MAIEKRQFGLAGENGQAWIYRLNGSNGLYVEITDFGGVILTIMAPDRDGKLVDICLGYDKLADYQKQGPYFGAMIGRVGNRIKAGRFELDGVEYTLAINNGPNHLHGGLCGFDKKLWNAHTESGTFGDRLILTYTSPDMEEGYPGNLDVTLTYTLTPDNALEMKYEAVSDKNTLFNPTNHAYFNLAGHMSGEVTGHTLRIDADQFTVNASDSVPTGEIKDVAGTPMDFRTMRKIGEMIGADYDQLAYGNGYDHNWILNREEDSKELKLAATAIEEKSGRCLEVLTTMPGIQFYSGNYLAEAGVGKEGHTYGKFHGFCLETQVHPDAIHHSNFPSAVLKAGKHYSSTTVYKFSTI